MMTLILSEAQLKDATKNKEEQERKNNHILVN